jgi:hypothetical protein
MGEDLSSKLIAYVRANGLSLSVSMPLTEDWDAISSCGDGWMRWKHTGDFYVTIGEKRYHEYCKGDMPRAREQVLARVAQDFNL